MRTSFRIGPNRSRCLSVTPMAARLAQDEKWQVVFVVDSFIVMVLLSSAFLPLIGMTHHPAFGKSLAAGSILPLLWTNFRYIERMIERPVSEAQFSPEQIKQWLTWLARQMKQHQLAEFYLESLQSSWLA